jgi:AraC-like DNA-binding protein
MLSVRAIQRGAVSVLEYRCNAGPGAAPYTEVHGAHSLSFVRKGSFGYRFAKTTQELVAGSVLTGHAGDEFMCTHEHHRCGDECLSLQFSEESADSFGKVRELFRFGVVPPVSRLMIAAERVEASARGHSGIALEEAALLFAGELRNVVYETSERPASASAHARRLAVQAALWIDEHSAQAIDLALAASQVKLSPFHFVKLFSGVLGVTPHQYLLRSRLRRAAQLLNLQELSITEVALEVGFQDLSNFVNSFRRACGVSPRAYRRAAHADRKICQDRL